MRKLAAALLFLCSCGVKRQSPVFDVQPALATESVTDDPDDPAIWIKPADPARSLVVGTNKVAAPKGALVVFDLDGKIRQTVTGLDRPNNVDIEYGLPLTDGAVDIAVAAERLKSQLRIFKVSAEGLADITSAGNTRVFADRTGEQAAPMGVSLYKRPRDGAIFAIVAPKNGPRERYLGQYRLTDDGQGRVKAPFVRYFGVFSGTSEIEAVAVDDELGAIYYADEGDGIHKYAADPDIPNAGAQLAHFGREGFRGDREGIAIYTQPGGKGYVVCTDQIQGNSEYHIFRREGEPGNPHDHSNPVRVVRGGADGTDGIEITSRALGPRFPKGLMVTMNSGPKNFLYFHWADILPQP